MEKFNQEKSIVNVTITKNEQIDYAGEKASLLISDDKKGIIS